MTARFVIGVAIIVAVAIWFVVPVKGKAHGRG